MAVGRKNVLRLSQTHGFLLKNYTYYPLLGGSFYVGWKLWDKLRGYYLNLDSTESNAHWYIDYAEKFQIKKTEIIENWEDNLSLTPTEKMYKQMEDNMHKLKLNNDNLVFKRQSKDKDDIFYAAGKVRNLENIVFLTEQDIKECDSPIKLQIKLDSVEAKNPFMDTSLTDLVNRYHAAMENYKLSIENSKKFRSDKEKLLGLPYLINRLQQYPEPDPYSWQYDLYTQLHGEEYNFMKGAKEYEEKINKYNYHEFLHPSVIAKYDTNSEEFDMFLRQLHYKSRTAKEIRDQKREYFCRKYMPILNLVNNKKLGNNLTNFSGFDIVHYLENKNRNNSYDSYLYSQYSGQDEQKLFRLTEEQRFLDKNKPNVYNIQYGNIDKEKIGIKPEEMHELLLNPQKKRGKYLSSK